MKDNSITRKLLKEFRDIGIAIHKWNFRIGIEDFKFEDIWILIGLEQKKKILKDLLDKLPNIPNKKEARRLRQEIAK